MSQFKCTLWPGGEVLNLNGEETLLAQLKKNGKKIKSSCGGCATCGDCMIVLKSGELNCTAQTFEELRLLGNVFHITKERLSCQMKVTGDITIDITSHEKNTFTGKNEKSSIVSGPKSTGTILKKREDIQKSVRENEEKAQAKPSENWYKHWEKEGEEATGPKKLGGNKRPRTFQYNEDNDNEDNDK